MERMHGQNRGARRSAHVGLIFIAAIAATYVGCKESIPPPPVVMPEDRPDWYDPEESPPPSSLDRCGEACKRLQDNKCEQGQPTANGHTCVERCVKYEKRKLVSFNPRCVARIKPGPDACRAATACEKLKNP